MRPQIVKDIRHAVDNDEWMWIVCHSGGRARTGKSTLCLDIGYEIYVDWEIVLNCLVFNLSQIIYKIKHGIPVRWPTRNLLHDRVPLIVWEDFGAYSNKAITQHDPAWDYFKGAFDTLGTKVAVVIANMQEANAPTEQLKIKFTHELFVPYRGHCKYDEITAQQDYKGWKPRQKKKWIQEFDFPPAPDEVFRRYDEQRMSLADEVLQKVEDCLVDTHLPLLVKKMRPIDIQLLKLIEQKGMLYAAQLEKEMGGPCKDAIIRLKSRQLITPVQVKGTYYKLDITPLGLEVSQVIEQHEKRTEDVKNLNL